MCWLASLIIKSPTSPHCCRGAGGPPPVSIAPPDMAAPGHVFTIGRAAEILGEAEELLWGMLDSLEPEGGCLWIQGTNDRQTGAFNDHALDWFREWSAVYKPSPPPPRP